MTLDVSVPDPPTLQGPQPRSDYDSMDNPDEYPTDDHRRGELETLLADGVWRDAFEEWADQTGLTEEQFQLIVNHGLIDAFDFYWDPQTLDAGFQSPTLPQAARDTLDTTTIDDIEMELEALGRTVTEVLENDYLLRSDENYGFYPDAESDNNYGSRDGA